MRFLLDAQLAPGLARKLREAGYAASHISDHLPVNAPDIAVAHEANARHAVLVSKDEDFVDFCRRGLLTGQLLWVRCGNMTTAGLWVRMAPLLPFAVEALEAGEQIVEVR